MHGRTDARVTHNLADFSQGASSFGLALLLRGELLKDEAMSRAAYPLKLPASVKAAAARLAKEDGVSLNQWIVAAVAQKVGAVEMAAAFFRQRAGDARPEDLHAILALAPERAPDPGDELLRG